MALYLHEAVALQRRVGEGADQLAVAVFAAVELVRHAAAGPGERLAPELARAEQLPHRRGDAAGAVEALAEIAARGLHVDEQGQVIAMILPDLGFQLDPGVARHRDDMRLRVRRADRKSTRLNSSH